MTYSNFYARIYTFLADIGETVKIVLKFYPARLYVVAIISLQVLAWMQAIFIYRRITGNLLILHYNINFGVDSVGDPSKIFLYPLLSLVVAVINSILVAVFVRRRESKFMAHLFFGSAVFFGIFLSLALLAIFLINFR